MDYEHSIPRLAQQESSVCSLLELYQWWQNWGNYDFAGVAILERLGEIGAGNSQAISTLKHAASGRGRKTSLTAFYALEKLAATGDEMAKEAFDEVQKYKQEEALKQQRLQQQRREKQLAADAELMGITVEELKGRMQQAEEERQLRILDKGGKKQYGESRFSPQDRVICLIEGWKYTNQIGIVERAINSKFVVVRFDDGYLTIQSDRKFKPI